MIRRTLSFDRIEDYESFLRIKRLPSYRFVGREALIPPEYAGLVGGPRMPRPTAQDYRPIAGLFDYQRDIAALAIRKRKFAVFADCGLGKTLVHQEFARHALARLSPGRRVLVVSPLMTIDQEVREAARFYGDSLPIERVKARDLPAWIASPGEAIGITNYEALDGDVPGGRLGCLILNESSMLKSHYGKWGRECLRLGRGLDWKLALTGTPAPNDRIEFANHAVFLDAEPSVNAFLARYFVNRGQTDNRWELKPHALAPFYRSLSHWSIFLTNPATYGWADNTAPLPPILVHVHDVDLTDEQDAAARGSHGGLFPARAGGIVSRTALARISKGYHDGGRIATGKPAFIRALIDSWPDESTIVWCLYNDEQDQVAAALPGAANVAGSTPQDERQRLVESFLRGEARVLISKPRILGFGLNLQVATRHVFSGLQDSYEQFYQAVKRSNRYGSTRPLNVHIPVTELERPMIETVLKKAARVQRDAEEQERIFKDAAP